MESDRSTQKAHGLRRVRRKRVVFVRTGMGTPQQRLLVLEWIVIGRRFLRGSGAPGASGVAGVRRGGSPALAVLARASQRLERVADDLCGAALLAVLGLVRADLEPPFHSDEVSLAEVVGGKLRCLSPGHHVDEVCF